MTTTMTDLYVIKRQNGEFFLNKNYIRSKPVRLPYSRNSHVLDDFFFSKEEKDKYIDRIKGSLFTDVVLDIYVGQVYFNKNNTMSFYTPFQKVTLYGGR